MLRQTRVTFTALAILALLVISSTAGLAVSGSSSEGGAWTELTTKAYDSDDKNYRDPVFSNGGGGSGLVTGRMSALAVQTNRGVTTVWAGAANGGVWKSTNGGN